MAGSVTKYGEEPNTWLLRWDAAPAADGKRNRKKKVYRGGKKQAEAELAKLVAETTAPAGVGPQVETKVAEVGLTFGDWLDDWIAMKADRNIGPQTLRGYHTHAKAIKEGIGAVPITDLTPKRISDYYRHVKTEGRQLSRQGRGKGLSKTTIHHHHVLIRASLKQAVVMGLIQKNPTDALEAPEMEKDRKMPALTPEEVQTLIRVTEGTPLYVPVVLSAYAGLREGEVLALSWRNVHLASSLLMVQQNAYPRQGGGMAFKEPKSEKSRRPVPLTDFVVEVLRRHQTTQNTIRENTPDWQDTGLVVTMEDGRAMRNDYLTKQFRKLRDELGWSDRIGFHCLRRTCATLMAHAGVPPRVTQDFLGHANLATTLGVYTNVVDGAREDAAARLGEVLGHVRVNTALEHHLAAD